MALDLLVGINGAAKLDDPSWQAVRLAGITRVHGDGRPADQFLFAEAAVSGQARVAGTATITGGTAPAPFAQGRAAGGAQGQGRRRAGPGPPVPSCLKNSGGG
jgi:hypothetical protein